MQAVLAILADPASAKAKVTSARAFVDKSAREMYLNSFVGEKAVVLKAVHGK